MISLEWLNPFSRPSAAKCDVPDKLGPITHRGSEEAPEHLGATRKQIGELWGHLEDVYRTGMHPALQVCVRREGQVVLHRSLGHASGNGPGDRPDTPKRLVDLDTPINIFSASKAVTAMLVHKLAWQGVLHLDDWVSDYIPEFARHGKERITLRHLLAHRAGLPNLPPDALDLDLLGEPERVVEIMCDAELRSRPGRLLAYHAVTGGFVLGSVIERATGDSLRDVLRREIGDPLGLHWFNYGVTPEHVDDVALNALTGSPPPALIGAVLDRALGAGLEEIVEMSNDHRFLEGVIPAANIITTADEMTRFFQCLLNGGQWDGKEVFDRRCVRHAVAEQSYREIDFTLMAPIRYGLGFMLGSQGLGLFGRDVEHAYGHVGLSNVFCWADPERKLSVALLTTGKPLLGAHIFPMFRFMNGLGTTFSKLEDLS
ncbi:MAG: serine hydrolase domain-containing protein [Myxococcota bacterium]|nr:serine hydrolase domain-containing protein [Myxococcota bacterium]